MLCINFITNHVVYDFIDFWREWNDSSSCVSIVQLLEQSSIVFERGTWVDNPEVKLVSISN